MTFNGWLLIVVYAALLVAMARPMGAWLLALYDRRKIAGGAVERGFYRLADVDPSEDMHGSATRSTSSSSASSASS